MPGKREEEILFHANRLFISSGYESTTMRQIAQAAQVSLGLTTYHYKGKRQVAVVILGRYLQYLKHTLEPLVDSKKDPLFASSAMVHLTNSFFMGFPCRQFYLDCLENEIYAEAICTQGHQSMCNIARVYEYGDSDDMLELFDNYITTAVEKILIIGKERGEFKNTPYERVPEIVFSVSVDHFLSEDIIRSAVEQGRAIAQRALASIPKDITDTLFLPPEHTDPERETI